MCALALSLSMHYHCVDGWQWSDACTAVEMECDSAGEGWTALQHWELVCDLILSVSVQPLCRLVASGGMRCSCNGM